jgi:photosystem II stability/assembly factor-like uncharacterized protein
MGCYIYHINPETMLRNLLTTLFLFYSVCSTAQLGWYTVPNAPVAPRFEDVSFIGMTGWIAENYNSAANGSVIHKTTDGGDTWTITDTIKPFSAFVRSVEFINDSTGFLGMLPNGGLTAGIYKTTDGGQSFNYINSPAFNNQGGVCGMAHYGNTVIGVGIYNDQRHFYKSVDAGDTWSVLTLGPTLVSGLVDCYMFNDSVYLACGQKTISSVGIATIIKSVDGGATWQQVALSTSSATWGWKLHFRGGTGSCSIQSSSNIFLTSDSGSTWTETFVGGCAAATEEFGGNGFLNDTLGWVGDQYFSHCLFETRDGGASWTPYTFGEAIDRMVILDSVTMLAVGATVYKYSFDSITTAVTPLPKEKQTVLTVTPNPANDHLTVNFEIRNPVMTNLQLLNSSWQNIKSFPAEVLQPGMQRREFYTADLPAGTYYVSLLTHTDHLLSKVTIVH